MSPERWQTVKRIFHDACERPIEQCTAFVVQACNGDTELANEVQSLLRQHERPENQLERLPEAQLVDVLSAQHVDPWIGARVGNYRVVERLGSGGMGAVYKAERDDDQYRAAVAIKFMRADSAALAEWRFRAERQILAGLDHRNIARLLDGGTIDGAAPYVVMELVQGEPIDRYCDARQLNVDERVQLFLQVCAAVQYAHQRLIVHRDLKPSNIFVTADGTVKLLDFGIAKLLHPDAIEGAEARDETATALRVMTLEYASPEQISGATITTASDIYSLGVLLYRLLAGQSPYRSAKDDTARMAEVLAENPPLRPSAAVVGDRHLVRALKGDLDNIVLLAMRKSPQERYASVEQLAADLCSHLAGRPVHARGYSLRYRSSTFVRRYRYTVAAAVLFVVALIAGIVATTWQARIAREQTRAAQEEARKAQAMQTFLTGLFERNTRQQSGAAHARNATVQEVLIQAADRIEKEDEFADTPGVKLEMLKTIVGLMFDLGEFERAYRLSHLAVATADNQGLRGSETHIRMLLALTESARLLGKGEEGMWARDEAIGILDGRGDRDSRLRARVLISTVAQLAPDPKREQTLVQEAIDIFARNYPENRSYFAAVYTLAHLQRTAGDFAAAAASFHRGIDVFKSSKATDFSNLGASYSYAGHCEMQIGEVTKALSHFERAAQLLTEHVGEDSYFMRDHNAMFAQALHEAGQLERSQQLFDLLLTPSALAKPTSTEFDAAVYRAEAYLQEGRPQLAEQLLIQFADNWEEFGGVYTINGVHWITSLALAQAQLGKEREARATLALVDRLPKHYGQQPNKMNDYLLGAAAVYLELADVESAIGALATVPVEPPTAFSAEFIEASAVRAAALLASGATEQAKRTIDLAFENFMAGESGAYPYLRANLLSVRGAIRVALHDRPAARADLDAAIELMRRYQAADSSALQAAVKLLRAVE